ncbi:protein kinase rio1 [Pichia californica]|uniref:Serine/threonine-protein kinase RIO1 n=1 Tax=Pichia californica TaxID=460514 RepID=A0A9P6WGD3_9ASCO|nr:protein kinase rio1 [[Candida] californica]KAG0686650.1 protein kinase rio1 [[Candida] californica]
MSDYSDNDSDDGNYSGKSKIHSVNRELKEKTDILDRYADKVNLDISAKHRITKDKALRATVDQVLDPRTLRFLEKIYNNGNLSKINGCISTGKEANIYYGENELTNDEFAVKIYKTSILVFKDRTRYVVGEHRFGEKQSKNPRQMVKNWAEKEFRNLKRLYSQPMINSPKPIELRENILVMQYLTRGNGDPSPKLRDYNFKDLNDIIHYYHEMLILMRLLFQKCRLVHADLSEYNTIVHDDKLYVFDVSQSVEPDHPMSIDFLRMDIKNVNDFFNRIKKIGVYSERDIFKFIITPSSILFENLERNSDNSEIGNETKEFLLDYLNGLNLKSTDDDEFNDEVFRSLHLVSSLHNIDERDFSKFTNGDIDTLVDLVGSVKINKHNQTEVQLDLKNETQLDDYDYEEAEDDYDDDDNNYDEEDDDDDKSSVDSDEEDDDESNSDFEDQQQSKLKRFQDKDEKKLHKQQVKEAAREKRKNKMKKNVKKKLVKKGKK